ncbi:MAG: AsnC family transcriptional regulator [Sedimentisphaerales bacterium]|nr:AsnC family transcriptional regulator [Sedimentisphaerales bacterium]
MDQTDKNILTALQNDFPICQHPYDVLAEKLGLSVEDLWERINIMIEGGVIRRMGASLDSKKLGYASTLAAVRIKPEHMEQASKLIGSFHEVTHSYQRDNEYNIWFTLIAESNARIDEILGQIVEKLKLSESDILNLPVLRLFKLDARFNADTDQQE